MSVYKSQFSIPVHIQFINGIQTAMEYVLCVVSL